MIYKFKYYYTFITIKIKSKYLKPRQGCIELAKQRARSTKVSIRYCGEGAGVDKAPCILLHHPSDLEWLKYWVWPQTDLSTKIQTRGWWPTGHLEGVAIWEEGYEGSGHRRTREKHVSALAQIIMAVEQQQRKRQGGRRPEDTLPEGIDDRSDGDGGCRYWGWTRRGWGWLWLGDKVIVNGSLCKTCHWWLDLNWWPSSCESHAWAKGQKLP